MKNTKIAVFFGGKISQHLVLVKKAAKKLGVSLDLISYNKICFDTEKREILIRPNFVGESKINQFDNYKNVNDYDVLFFRTTGKHWEEVDLILNSIKKEDMVVIDPLVRTGKPSMACKAWQMLALKTAGIEVPKTVYGSLWYLYEIAKGSQPNFLQSSLPSGSLFENSRSLRAEKMIASPFIFPLILKGSGGDRGTRVYKTNNLEEMEKLVRDLRKSETEEGRRYMLQEYIPNDGDFRVEVADLPEEIKQLAVKAAKVCGLAVAGVDVAFRDNNFKKPIIWEVNKGPQFKGFMQATGIDVPVEIVKFLVGLKPLCPDKSGHLPLTKGEV
jgi:glutathione synthase/RimK-type ligase-like ATP-grasp enzyme